jgi:hypothetical protein
MLMLTELRLGKKTPSSEQELGKIFDVSDETKTFSADGGKRSATGQQGCRQEARAIVMQQRPEKPDRQW